MSKQFNIPRKHPLPRGYRRSYTRRITFPSQGMLLLLIFVTGAYSLAPPAYSFENKLRFPYGINFKFNGHIYHNLERVWVVQRINVPHLADVEKLPDLPSLPSCDFKDMGTGWKITTLQTMCKLARPSLLLLQRRAHYFRTQIVHMIEKELFNAMYGLTPVGLIPYNKPGALVQTLQAEQAAQVHNVTQNYDSHRLNFKTRLPPFGGPLYMTRHKMYLMSKHNLSRAVQHYAKSVDTDSFQISPAAMELISSVRPVSRQKRFWATVASIAGKWVLKGIGALATMAVESISHHIQKKRNKAIAKAMTHMAQNIKMNNHEVHMLQRDFLLYGDYNLNSTEQILKVLQSVDGRTSLLEYWLNTSDSHWTNSYTNHLNGVAIYNHQMQLYIDAYKQRFIHIQEKLLEELKLLLHSISTLARGYLPVQLFPPSRIAQLSAHAVQMIQKTHPDYVLAFNHVTDYYDMPLITFGRDDKDRLVVCFPIFLKEFHRTPLTLYQIETVKVPINDLNTKADSYTQIQVSKPYLATNQEHYIQLMLPELRMCKSIRHTYFCEELFLIKHKSKSSCESALFYKQPPSLIQDVCTINYFYNITVMPSVLDGGDSLVLANFKQKKNLVCLYDQELAKPLPQHEYSLVKRNILCYCHIQIGYTTVPQTISDCNATAFPNFYSTVNLGFWTDLMTLFNDSNFKVPLSLTSKDYVLPVSLTDYSNDSSFSAFMQKHNKHASLHPTNTAELKATIAEYRNFTLYRKKLFNDKGRDNVTVSVLAPLKKSSFLYTTILHIYLFIGSTIGILHVIPNVILAIRMKRTSALMGALATYPQQAQAFSFSQNVICTHPYLGLFISAITILGIVVYLYRNCRHLTWYRGYKFNNTCEVFLFFCTDKHYVPVKVAEFSGTPYMLCVLNMITNEEVIFMKGPILCGWDQIKITWKNCTLWHHARKMKLKSVMNIPLRDKIRFRRILKKDHRLVLMVKQHDSWFQIPDKPIYSKPFITRTNLPAHEEVAKLLTQGRNTPTSELETAP